MKLSELQQYFAAAATTSKGPAPGLDDVFVSRGALSASERLAIYNRGYYYRLLDALGSVFADTKRALGEAEFKRIGLAYLTQHPSEHAAVERVGRRFAGYLRVRFPAPNSFGDVADLDWARLCALVAPNPATVARAHQLLPAQFPSSRLRFVPSLQCLQSTAVWRAGHTVAQRSLKTLEFQALGAAMTGASMSRVCALFDTGELAADTQRTFAVLSAWFAREWVERVVLDGG